MQIRLSKTRNARLTTRDPHGITLVEMLISMAITLLMMAAVVGLFASVGEGVRNRRARTELGGQLRLTRARLFRDLAGATCAARPKLPSDDHDDGYIEIVEGVFSDRNPSGLIDGNPANGELDYSTSIIPSGGDPQIIVDGNTVDAFVRVPAVNDVTNGGALGDYDDILALTVRSDSEPFVGRAPVWADSDGDGTFEWETITIESDLAEVIWYAVENPADGSLGEPGIRTLYRRVLLIAPWITDLPPTVAVTSPPALARDAIPSNQIYFQVSDISFRLEGTTRVANTLSDLTKRENRFAHLATPGSFPHVIDATAVRVDPANTVTQGFPTGSVSVLHPFGLPFEADPTDTFVLPDAPTIPPGDTVGVDREGEDAMLNDVLAFDLRVYDPGAPQTLAGGLIVEPSDAGWVAPTAVAQVQGYGAYVDMGWSPSYVPFLVPGTPQARFQDARQAGWHPRLPATLTGFPAVYDTWSLHYENDGIDQDDASDNLVGAAGIDQGTDGLDNVLQYDLDNDSTTPSVIPANSAGNQIAINGVDDAGERETAPPYDVPLRGIQIKLRIYDRDTRQIREATVTRNFVPQ